MDKNYYDILGVSETASQDEIKRAYRKMSRKYHPDLAGPEFEEKFKDVNNAFDVLSDPDKRRLYDQGVDPNQASAGFAGAQQFNDFGDIFSQFFGQGFTNAAPQEHMSRQQKGRDTLTNLTISLQEAAFGVQKTIEIQTYSLCPDCQGTGSQHNKKPIQCPDCQGTGYKQTIRHTLLGQIMSSAPCDRCQGYGTIIEDPCPQCQGQGRVKVKRKVSIKVPAGINDGMRVRLASQGEVGECGGPAGDLYVNITVKPDKVFTRQNDDLHCWVKVPMAWAVLGHTLDINTFDGSQSIEINAGTQQEDVIVKKNLGMTRLNSDSRGDLYVHVQIEIPTNLTAHQKELMEEFAQSRQETDNTDPISQESQPIKNKKSFFDRIKDALN